jgi:hypothetical protein
MRSSHDMNRVIDFFTSLAMASDNLPRRRAYDHMSAILSDAVLQAGLNYGTVVVPRIKRLLTMFPQERRTSQFLELLRLHTPEAILEWRHPEKPRRLMELTELCVSLRIDDKEALSTWLGDPNAEMALLQIRGIGPKTIDYLKLLAGISTIAVDRHARTLVAEAGIVCNDYQTLKNILVDVSTHFNMSPSALDYAIWQFMSTRPRSGRAFCKDAMWHLKKADT